MIAPGSPEWVKLITPSKVPAILGVSRFTSQYALWHEMAGIVEHGHKTTEAQQDDFDYGHAAEYASAEYWRLKNPGWRLSPGEVQYTNPDLPFPNLATIDRRGSRGRSRRVVEMKTARDLGEYGDDGTGTVPMDYAAQVVTQQLITGWTDPADLVLWPQFGKPKIYHVNYDTELADMIVAQCVAWMDSLTEGTPPELDDSVTTYETVRAQHPDIEPGEVDIDPTLARDYLEASHEHKAVEKYLRGLKSQLLDALAGKQHAVVGDLKIASRRPARGDSVALYPNGKALEPLIDREVA